MDERRRRLALRRYRLFASFYDIFPGTFRLSRRLREEAVRRLDVGPGDSVLDVGCGTGLSFGLIEERIGRQGRLIGVELSPDMLARARQKVAARGWRNVTLVEAAVEEADIPGEVDAALLFFTHDVLQSDAALSSVLAHVKPGGRVVSSGGKSATRPWQLPMNLALLLYWPFVTTTAGSAEPWARLAALLPDLRVEERLFGAAYMAWATTARS